MGMAAPHGAGHAPERTKMGTTLNKYDYSWIAVLIALFAICVAIILIISVLDRQNVLVREHDFISDYIEKKKKFLAKNKSVIDINVYMMMIAGCMLLTGFVGFLLTRNYYVMLGTGLVGFFIPDFVVRFLISSKNQKFDEKLERTLSNLSSSLRAGLTISQAVEEVCNSPFVDEDMKAFFRQMNSRLKMGESIESTFQWFADVTQSSDVQDVASAISMQVKVGGNEATVIESITSNISSRMNMRSEIKSIFSDAKFTIIIFDIMPPVMLAVMYVMMPSIFSELFNSLTGIIVFCSCMGVMLFGSFVTRKIMNNALNSN